MSNNNNTKSAVVRKPPSSKQTIRFYRKGTDNALMPCIVVDQGGTRVAMTGSYNEFASKEEVNKYLNANRVLAKHFFLDVNFEKALGEVELRKTVSYSTKIDL